MPHSRLVKYCFYAFTIAQVISIFGDRLHQFSVVGMIGKIDPGSSLQLFQLGLFSYLPILIFAPLFGSLIDRSNKALVLIVVDLFRGVLVLFVPLLFKLMGNLYAFYVPVFLLALANLWFAPAKSAIIPEVFGTRYLLQINALLWGLGIVGTLAGFMLGGWLFDFHSWQLSFYSDGASYLISVLFLLPLLALVKQRSQSANDRAPDPETRRHVDGTAKAIRRGLLLIRESRPVCFSLVVQTSLFATLGVLYVIAVARIQSVFPPDKTIYLSAVASAATVGLLLGSGIATVARRWLSTNTLIAQSTLLFACTWIGVARTESLLPMVCWAFVMGLSISPIAIVTETLLQITIPQAFRGRVFSTREVLTKTSFIIGSSLATFTTVFISKPVIMVSVGVFLAGIGLLLLRKDFLNA